MCESVVYVEEKGAVSEVLRDVARIATVEGAIVCTSIIGERVEIKGARFKEANFLSHGIVFTRD